MRPLLLIPRVAAGLIFIAPAMADEAPPPNMRIIGSTIYTLDARGHPDGKVRETSPGRWELLDKHGIVVRVIQVPEGCAPVGPCAAARPARPK